MGETMMMTVGLFEATTTTTGSVIGNSLRMEIVVPMSWAREKRHGLFDPLHPTVWRLMPFDESAFQVLHYVMCGPVDSIGFSFRLFHSMFYHVTS